MFLRYALTFNSKRYLGHLWTIDSNQSRKVRSLHVGFACWVFRNVPNRGFDDVKDDMEATESGKAVMNGVYRDR